MSTHLPAEYLVSTRLPAEYPVSTHLPAQNPDEYPVSTRESTPCVARCAHTHKLHARAWLPVVHVPFGAYKRTESISTLHCVGADIGSPRFPPSSTL